MNEYSQPRDPRVERALDHPTRRSILDMLIGEKGLGLNSIAGKLEVTAANAAYHVDVLLACGLVAVAAGNRGGERLIRLPQPSSGGKKRGPAVSDALRDDVSDAQLKSLIEMAAHLRPRHAPGT